VKQVLLFVILSLPWLHNANAAPTDLPTVTQYALQFRLFPKEEMLEAIVRMTVTNNTDQPFSEIPFLLYRLLEVQKVTDDNGSPLPFKQTITRLAEADVHNLQVSSVKVQVVKPLPPGAATNLTITYNGSIYGYAEIWGYVKDRVSEEYSLLRPDALAYPMLATATLESWIKAYGHEWPFTYDLTVTVPEGYVAASGGAHQNVSTKEGLTTFVFKSKRPTWRIDLAAAKFKIVADEANKLSVYVLTQDQKNAAAIVDGVSRSVKLYSKMFGELKDYQGYTVIEIPDGWGSQASDYYFLQVASTFDDVQHLAELYHEVAHSWNAKPKSSVQRCRWFDEAFAMYFQALAIREFEGQDAYRKELDRDRENFINRVNRDKRNFDIPIVDYDKYDLGGNSYSKGPWSLYVLHELVGEETFKQIIHVFLTEFRETPADFKDFQKLAERVSHRSLEKYFQDWFYTSVSSQLLADTIPVIEIVKRY